MNSDYDLEITVKSGRAKGKTELYNRDSATNQHKILNAWSPFCANGNR